MNTRALLCALSLTLASSALALDPIQQDHLTQAKVRQLGTQKQLSTRDDAAGGVDGVKNGEWGFHTHTDAKSPQWWQVDLGQVTPIARVLVYNREVTADRTTKMQLLLSDDGKAWRSVFTNDGARFKGFSDKKPLHVDLKDKARFVRVQIPTGLYLCLDEIEVYGESNPNKNIALNQPADQSSVSQWSKRHGAQAADAPLPMQQAIEQGLKLAADLRAAKVDTSKAESELNQLKTGEATQENYLKARAVIRQLTLSNPALDFEHILFLKRAPGSFSHMSDQYYSWWSRSGGGVFILENFKTNPKLRCLTESFALGSFLSPDLSYDGKKVLFSYCRHYDKRDGIANKTDKDAQPDDAFYHVFEMNLDGTGMRQLTKGRYDDTFPRYLPDGKIVFLSTRRGTFTQCGRPSAQATEEKTQPDSYVRCGGDNHRPVSVYTLHTMSADGADLTAISAFESFEWDPSVAADGRVFYSRWDYVDRDNMPYMKLWATRPDGTNPQIIFGNYTKNPQSTFEARSIPGSSKIIMTASAHHSITAGSLVLFDPAKGAIDGTEHLTRLTPEVCFPESEGWPTTYFNTPYPLSETYYLTSWSNIPLASQGRTNPINAMGLYLFDAFGNLEPLYRDAQISSMYPLPVRSRPKPPAVNTGVDWIGKQEGRLFIQDIYAGMQDVERGAIKSLRVVAMPIKTQPHMNTPNLGHTRDDPGKAVLGTVPVESDGSAYLRVPSGVGLFFQALDSQGRAVQTMRSLTYVQPGQTLSCVGCHEDRNTAPSVLGVSLAMKRKPSKLKPGPEGSWPMRYDKLVQNVLDAKCTSCHTPGAKDAAAAKLDLTEGKSWATLTKFGKPNLNEIVWKAYRDGRSFTNQAPSMVSSLMDAIEKSPAHKDVKFDQDAKDRLILWMDTYAQRLGHFSETQEKELLDLRKAWAEMLE